METSKYPFDLFAAYMKQDCPCIEISFCIDGDAEYDYCWLGKGLFEHIDKDRPLYWFGISEDGSQAYDYYTFDEFATAKVFRGKSLKELWDLVSIYSVFGPGMDITLNPPPGSPMPGGTINYWDGNIPPIDEVTP